VIVTATREVIDVPDLPEPVREARPVSTRQSLLKPGMTLEQLEREAIRGALRQTDGNRTWAAQQLGISLRTLQRKIRRYGL
jgi:transcriptional regulator with PAS, ATPase and Fis domain